VSFCIVGIHFFLRQAAVGVEFSHFNFIVVGIVLRCDFLFRFALRIVVDLFRLVVVLIIGGRLMRFQVALFIVVDLFDKVGVAVVAFIRILHHSLLAILRNRFGDGDGLHPV